MGFLQWCQRSGVRLFNCQECGQVVYFENTWCSRCGHKLGYLPHMNSMSSVVPDGPNWIAAAAPDRLFRFCQNWELNACNWLVEADSDHAYCLSCRHNRTIPDLSAPDAMGGWTKIEAAKRRLFYSLLRLNLPTPTAGSGDPEPLMFDILSEMPNSMQKVMTGHENGLITISLAEADDVARETMRATLGEPYRTLLGHFRHEIGHYFWDRLVRDSPKLERFREIFGDEREDYSEALSRHYQLGAPPDWPDHFVSAYSTMHPWENWAETWAHYLHMVDTLETAHVFGIGIDPIVTDDEALRMRGRFDPYGPCKVEDLVEAWLPLTHAVNSLNRSMGQPDLYPFVISPAVVSKMTFVHDVIRDR